MYSRFFSRFSCLLCCLMLAAIALSACSASFPTPAVNPTSTLVATVTPLPPTATSLPPTATTTPTATVALSASVAPTETPTNAPTQAPTVDGTGLSKGKLQGLAVRGDGQIAIAHAVGVTVYTTPDFQAVLEIPVPGGVNALAYSPDGAELAGAAGGAGIVRAL